jgi:uncharacterized protein YbjT (DUF2867 family)
MNNEAVSIIKTLGDGQNHHENAFGEAFSAPVTVLLLGATGFIGSYALRALLAQGLQVLAVRRQHASRTAAPSEAELGGRLRWLNLHAQHLTQPEQWSAHLQGIQVVINCIGILRQRLGERYDAVHHRMPAALAQACAQAGVRLIHTSALGLHEHAKSRFLSSKLEGEQALARTAGLDYCILRPSLIDGLGGFGASWLRMLSRWPVHFVPRGAVGRIAAVQAVDLGEAYARLALLPTLANHRQANLGGTRLFAYAEYLQMLRGVEDQAVARRPALQIFLPNWVTRVGAHLCDLFRFSPFSYGHWILLQRDNVPLPNALPGLLQRAPLPVVYSEVPIRDDFRLS